MGGKESFGLYESLFKVVLCCGHPACHLCQNPLVYIELADCVMVVALVEGGTGFVE